MSFFQIAAIDIDHESNWNHIRPLFFNSLWNIRVHEKKVGVFSSSTTNCC